MGDTALKERFRQFAIHKGYASIRQFEINSGLPNGYVNNAKSVTYSRRYQLESIYPDLNIEWLLEGKGNMFKEEGEVLKVPQPLANEQDNACSPNPIQFALDFNKNKLQTGGPRKKGMVPLVPTELYHKANVDIYNELMNARINGVELLPLFPVFTDYNFYVRVLDESMSPEYKSGDVLAIRAMDDDEQIISGNLYILDLKRTGLLFRMLKDRGTEFECVALGDRDRFENLSVKKDDIFRVYAVKGMFRLCS